MITIITVVIVGKYVVIAADLGMVLVVVEVLVAKTVSMTVIEDCQYQDGTRVTIISVDNNRSIYFMYILKHIFLALAYI